MELGLSLGDTTSKNLGFLTKSSANTSKNGGLGFCMALGMGSNGRKESELKSKENEEHAVSEERISRDGVDEDDDGQRAILETPVQLDLLPLAPVPRQTVWSSDNGSSENGSSGNMGLTVARGFDVNRLAGGGGEEVSSANSGAAPFQIDFSSFYRNGGSRITGGRSKRDSEAAGNDAVEADRAGSRASDEDENGANTRKKLRLSKEQSAFLEESFKEHSTLNPKQKLALAKELNLRPRQVEVWFQNRRARTKLKQTEVDCEYLKRCCETLTEENRRLHKELQELRALKTSNPFYMQLPATTLTMCPSCERVATTSTAPPTATNRTFPTSSTTTTTTTTTSSAKTMITDSTPKAIPFPLSRSARLIFPFSTSPSHQHQSAAS